MTDITSDVLQQVRAVRNALGVLERAEVGWLEMRGADRYTWLQGMVSNDIRLLQRGATRLPACVLDATGHLLSDITFLQIPGESSYLLAELPLKNMARIAASFDRLLIMEDVEITDVTARIACFSFQGPTAGKLFRRTKPMLAEPILDFPGLLTVVEADHTGSGGFDVVVPVALADAFRDMLHKANMVEVGGEAQEILRVEAGIPKYGIDMDESVIALEANLGPTHISLTKGCYVGQEIIARIDSRGHTNRALTGLKILEGGLPCFADKIYAPSSAEDPEGRETGRITSVIASSPAVGGIPIALGYVRHEHREPGKRLHIGSCEGSLVAEVVPLPFYLRGDL